MNQLPRTMLAAGCSIALLVAAPAPADGPAPPTASAPAADPPRPIGEIVVARPFILDEPFEFDWRAERPSVRSGWILVLAVDPAVVRPRQVAEPVLYVGGQTAERLNIGAGAGRLVVIVPAPLDDAGQVRAPHAEAPVFFGSAMLPEQVDAATVAREVAAARAAGISVTPAAPLAEARARGGDMLRSRDRAALLAATAPLVRQFAPDERDRADLLEGKPIERTAG